MKRPIQLTLAGKRLQELAVPLVEGLDALVQSASEAEERGPVVLVATPDIIPHTLLSVVRVFTSLHPQIHLTIRSAPRTQIMQMIADGEADIGIVQHYDRDEAFLFEGLFVYERVLITPVNHPLAMQPVESIEQIAKYPLIMMIEGTHTRDLLESEFKRRGISYEIVVDLDSMDMIKRYVALGNGYLGRPKTCNRPGRPRKPWCGQPGPHFARGTGRDRDPEGQADFKAGRAVYLRYAGHAGRSCALSA